MGEIERRIVMIKRLLGNKIKADKKHPWLLCKTCGKTTNRIHCKQSDTLRTVKEKPKTYKRTIKYSAKYKTKYRKRICKKKEIFYSYDLLECIRKHHKLSVRRAPFSIRNAVVVC